MIAAVLPGLAALREWFDYMMHLNTRYPFLYSFASRTNPLRPDADVTVRE